MWLRCFQASSKTNARCLAPALEIHLDALHQLASPGTGVCWFSCSRKVQRRGGLKWSEVVLASSREMPDAGTGSILCFVLLSLVRSEVRSGLKFNSTRVYPRLLELRMSPRS